MPRTFSAIYRDEWLKERTYPVEYLGKLHLEITHKYTKPFVRISSGALAHRRGQELRAMTNAIRLYSKAEWPTFGKLEAIGMTVPTSTRMASFQRHKASEMTDTAGFSPLRSFGIRTTIKIRTIGMLTIRPFLVTPYPAVGGDLTDFRDPHWRRPRNVWPVPPTPRIPTV